MYARALALAVLLSGLVSAPAVRAQDAPAPAGTAEATPPTAPDAAYAEALERFGQAQAQFQRGDHAGALAEFERIYTLLEGNPRQPAVLFNMGRAQEELHRYDRAISAYERYLEAAATDAPNRADVEASLRALDRLLGTIAVEVVSADPAVELPDVELWVDGELEGQAPRSLRVPGGQHLVELRAAGFEAARQEVLVVTRQSSAVRVELRPLSQYRGVSPALFATTAALAAVSAGVGAGFGAQALTLHDDVDRCAVTPMCMIDPEAEGARIRDAAVVADVLFAGAGVLGVTAVVLAFVTDWGGAPATPETGPRVQVTPVVGPGLALAQLSVRY